MIMEKYKKAAEEYAKRFIDWSSGTTQKDFFAGATYAHDELQPELSRLIEVDDCNKRTVMNQRQEIGELQSELTRLREEYERLKNENERYLKTLTDLVPSKE